MASQRRHESASSASSQSASHSLHAAAIGPACAAAASSSAAESALENLDRITVLVAEHDSHCLQYLAGAYRPPPRFIPSRSIDQPQAIQLVFQTLTVLWDGRSERLAALAVPGIRRDNTLHQHRFVYLLQWVQGALWAAAVTPVFELRHVVPVDASKAAERE